jgi:hypothetical protein
MCGFQRERERERERERGRERDRAIESFDHIPQPHLSAILPLDVRDLIRLARSVDLAIYPRE